MAHLTLVLLAAACLFAGSVDGIIIRHDRDDAVYLERGRGFPMVGTVGRAGDATLIAPTWAVTAAHVERGTRSKIVTFEGVPYPIAAVFAHPEWTEMGPHDIALIQLGSPVTGVTSAGLYTARDEAGQAVTFVGHGGTGTGLTGPRTEDGRRRAATNTVERADAAWLHFTFDAPPKATDLEGISGPGDSGGPAFIRKDGQWLVAGISVFGQPGAKGRGTYGAREGYSRVSSYAEWIRRTMSGPGAASTTPVRGSDVRGSDVRGSDVRGFKVHEHANRQPKP